MTKEIALYPQGIYRTVVVDTINAFQNALYTEMMSGKKGTFDAWRDFGIEVYQFYNWIKSLEDAVLVQILGTEGTGKTVGAKHLDPKSNVILNADNKPLSFFGAKKMYRTSITPEQQAQGLIKNLTFPQDYEQAKAMISAIHAKRKGTFVVFILGHLENYNLPNGGVGQRLKVLGKQATKLGIEGLNTIHTYYTKIDSMYQPNDPQRYKLETFNSGSNTVRSPEGYWEGEILNNYQLIVNRILEDSGELETENTN